MAQLAAPLQAQIDRELAHALIIWGRLPETLASFSSWREEDAQDFVFEWTVEEDRLRRLAAHAASDELTGEQMTQYHALSELVQRHRPLVEQIIGA